jgi:hypothetical protein
MISAAWTPGSAEMQSARTKRLAAAVCAPALRRIRRRGVRLLCGARRVEKRARRQQRRVLRSSGSVTAGRRVQTVRRRMRGRARTTASASSSDSCSSATPVSSSASPSASACSTKARGSRALGRLCGQTPAQASQRCARRSGERSTPRRGMRRRRGPRASAAPRATPVSTAARQAAVRRRAARRRRARVPPYARVQACGRQARVRRRGAAASGAASAGLCGQRRCHRQSALSAERHTQGLRRSRTSCCLAPERQMQRRCTHAALPIRRHVFFRATANARPSQRSGAASAATAARTRT